MHIFVHSCAGSRLPFVRRILASARLVRVCEPRDVGAWVGCGGHGALALSRARAARARAITAFQSMVASRLALAAALVGRHVAAWFGATWDGLLGEPRRLEHALRFERGADGRTGACDRFARSDLDARGTRADLGTFL